MKKLDFEILQKEDLFTVHIGKGEWLRFENLTRAKTFVRKYKTVINDNVAMLNLMQPQLNSLYRQNILSLDSGTQREISNNLSNFEERFDFIFQQFSPGNQNAFVFGNIIVCLNSLIEVSRLLYSYAQRYKHYGLTATVLPIIKNLEMIDRQMNLDKKNLFVQNGYRKNYSKVIAFKRKNSQQ